MQPIARAREICGSSGNTEKLFMCVRSILSSLSSLSSLKASQDNENIEKSRTAKPAIILPENMIILPILPGKMPRKQDVGQRQ
jgi:hypothetical protein